MTLGVAIIVTIGSVVVGFFTYLGARAAAVQSRRAATETAAVTAESTELAAWRELAREYRSRLERLEDRQGETDAKVTAAEEALEEEREQRRKVARELDRERTRINGLTAQLRAAVAYIGSLLTLLRAHEIEPPSPPDGLDIELP